MHFVFRTNALRKPLPHRRGADYTLAKVMPHSQKKSKARGISPEVAVVAATEGCGCPPKERVASEAAEHHAAAPPPPTSAIHVLLRPEPDPTSRTQVAYRAYWHANGLPIQALHVAGETEADARWRVLQFYPFAVIELEAAPKTCCASCAAGGPCAGSCSSKPGLTRFSRGHVGEAGEPLLAVWEEGQTEEDVMGCGACAAHPTGAGHPAVLRIERASRNPAGGYALETAHEVPLSAELQSLYSSGGACQGETCLPWVRVQRDPQRFRAALEAARKIGPVTSSKVFYKLVKDHLTAQDQEVFYVLLLDVHNNIRGISEISRGARDRVLTPIPDVLRLPLVDGATGFIVAHNHPSGNPKPSAADKEVTKAIKEAADAVNVLFIDHIIVGANSYYSFSDHGLV